MQLVEIREARSRQHTTADVCTTQVMKGGLYE